MIDRKEWTGKNPKVKEKEGVESKGRGGKGGRKERKGTERNGK